MKSLLAACVATLALVAVGCGGNGEASSAEDWADEFCTLVQDWRTELDQIGDEVGDDLSTDSIEQAAEDANDATEDFAAELRDLGGPDTEAGDAIDQEVEELGDTVDAEREDLEQAVEDADGLSGAAEVIGQVGESLSAMTSALRETIEAIDDADPGGEVRTALEQNETCDEVLD